MSFKHVDDSFYEPQKGGSSGSLLGPVILVVAILAVLGYIGYTKDWFRGKGEIYGRVVDSYNMPFIYADVQLTCKKHDTAMRVMVNQNGEFVFRGVHSGKYEVRIFTWVGEYPMTPRIVAVKPNFRQRVDLVIDQQLLGEQKSKSYMDYRTGRNVEESTGIATGG
ncbi:MAG: carboxypeptidase regulatory-like domain-containing protein [bacterium]|jgi:hypothetical protein